MGKLVLPSCILPLAPESDSLWVSEVLGFVNKNGHFLGKWSTKFSLAIGENSTIDKEMGGGHWNEGS